MSTPSVKSKIVKRFLELLVPLKQQKGIREIERKNTLFLTTTTVPAIHLVIGHEVSGVDDERGYTCVFPAMLKITLEDGNDPAAKCDELVGWIQEKIEADEQLVSGGAPLASKVTYMGEMPFTEELAKPKGGSVISFEVEYRRRRAQPGVSY